MQLYMNRMAERRRMTGRTFNAEMLTIARESRGLTQTELANLIGVTQGEISKLENRIREPEHEQVERLSEALRYTAAFFYLSESFRGPATGCIYHRKRKSIQQGVLREVLARVNVRRIQIRNFLRAADFEVEGRFIRLELEDHHVSPQDVAKMIRRHWGIVPGPIPNLTRTIEDAGGIVIPTDFGTRKIDAVSQMAPGLPPLFFVNSASPTDRLRYTLAHEIGHIVMHDGPTDDMEKEADQFAAEFLMPAAEIGPALLNATLPKLAALKPYWKMSMAALLTQAGNLGAIPPRRKSYMWMRMGQLGYRTKEPNPIPPEEATLFQELVGVHKNDLGYSDMDLAQASYWTDVSEVREVLLGKKEARLRLVR